MYEKSITRENRSAFVIMIDQSGSMAEPIDYEGRTMTKAEAVAEVTNLIIEELIERARRSDGVRDYYDIGIVGYSGSKATSMLSDDERVLIPVTELSERNVESRSCTIERCAPDGTTFKQNLTTKMWVAPMAMGETPMYEGMNMVYDIMKSWCAKPENYYSFPPMIFNITDGESSDCTGRDMLNMARKIRSLSTADGKVFMINVHIASSVAQKSVIFPTTEEVEASTNKYAKDLGLASSTMPEAYNDMICEIKGEKLQGDFVGVSYNTSIEELITILNIGTISVKKG
ncbi:MAG: VWA domain-containing protein [Rikenellaceae bacterium]